MDIFADFPSLLFHAGIYVVPFLIVLGILVFVHEWGHYIVARLCGVRVDVFSIGFGHELWGFNDRQGTRWKISLIPLGGYVKLYGDVDPASAGKTDQVTDAPQSAPRPMTAAERETAFFAQPVWRRSLIVVAGPAINYVFAIALLAGLFAWSGQPVTPPIAAAIVKGSSADQAGFMPQDKVLSIDGVPVQSFEDIRRSMLISLNEPQNFMIERGGQKIEVRASAEKIESKDHFGFVQSRGKLGLVGPSFGIDTGMMIAVDGQTVSGKEAAISEIAKRLDTQFTITIKPAKDGEAADIYIVHPTREANALISAAESADYGVLKISMSTGQDFIHFSLIGAVIKAAQESWNISVSTLEAIWQMFTGTRSATELGGIIRIGALAGDMAQQGIIALIMFTALLSINLGLINLFPIPMLDGGHLVFYAFEAALGRPVPEQIQEYAFRFGFGVLICLMVFANLNDLVQLLL